MKHNQSIKALILDMDGVLWRDTHPIGDLPVLFHEIEIRGWKTAFVTNNATRSIDQYVQKLATFGVQASRGQIINSGVAAGINLKNRFPSGGPVYILGEQGLFATLEDFGFNHSVNQPLAVIASLFILTALAAVVSWDDIWVVLDDDDDTDVFDTSSPYWAVPPTAFVASGPGGVPATTVELTEDGSRGVLTRRWDAVAIAPGATVGFLQVLSAQSSRDRAVGSAERLSQLPPELLMGLAAEEGEVLYNVDVPEGMQSSLPPLHNDGVVLGQVLGGDAQETQKQVSQLLHSKQVCQGRGLGHVLEDGHQRAEHGADRAARALPDQRHHPPQRWRASAGRGRQGAGARRPGCPAPV